MAVRWSSPSDRKLFAARPPARLARRGRVSVRPAPMFSTGRAGFLSGLARMAGRWTHRRLFEWSNYRTYLDGLGGLHKH